MYKATCKNEYNRTPEIHQQCKLFASDIFVPLKLT
uniref:Uncharacterized protein n=1 Tax=Anguilla anguilla TaxID=7936 RepID=A0A0E9RFS8_ANGAN